SAQSTTRNVTGTGDAPAVLSISNGPTYDYSDVATGTSLDHTFTVSYSGGVSATSVNGTGLTAPFEFKDGSYPGTGGTCGTTINSNCTIVVTFSPTANVTSNDTIEIGYDDGVTTQTATRPIEGTGVNT